MLDKIIGSVLSNVIGGSANSSSASVITSVLGALLQKQGGMEGIFNQLQKGGLEDLLNSWIGTGKNKSLDAEQVSDVFGEDTLNQVAEQAGVDKTQAQDILSQALPQVIDMLTPNGREGGVSAETIVQQAQQSQQQASQQDNGFGLDDLLGGLGSLLGGQQASQTTGSQGGLGDLLGQLLNQPTQTSQTQAPSANNELARDIGSVLNNVFK
ncbi:YidB family protein [Lonepinella sp. BR2474]|uniref:YidB family protein n=1 Tax=Lonepinella sp. BR2474 TaxID=3434548 RepID=UPI003F6E3D42